MGGEGRMGELVFWGGGLKGEGKERLKMEGGIEDSEENA